MQSSLLNISDNSKISNLKTCCNNILVVDDNDLNIFSLQQILEVNYKIGSDACFNGSEALQKAK